MAEITLNDVAADMRAYSLENGASFSADECAQIARLIDAAIKQREQDKLDVARYRWLRDKSGRAGSPYIRCDDPPFKPMDYWITAGTADSCIDRAMAEESGQ